MPVWFRSPSTYGDWWITNNASSTATSSTASLWLNNQIITGGTSSTCYPIYVTTASPVIITNNTFIDTQIKISGSIWCEPAAPFRPASPAIIRPPKRRTVQEEAAEIVRRMTERRNADKARQRAHKLLLSHLSDEQKETFFKNGWFIVEGGKSKRRYRIRTNHYAGNIDVFDGDKITHRLCCHAADASIPLHDQLLSQKMMLEMDEDDFLKIANRTAVA